MTARLLHQIFKLENTCQHLINSYHDFSIILDQHVFFFWPIYDMRSFFFLCHWYLVPPILFNLKRVLKETMAEKVSTLVLKVDLGCSKCYNKVRKTLCQHHYNIRSQVIDTKAGTITITGPFDPVDFEKKLKSKAGKAIKNIDIKKKEEEKPKAKEADKPAEKPKAKEAEKPAEKPKAKEADKPAEAKADKPKQADKPKEDKAAEKPKEDKGAEKPKKVTFDEPPKAAAPTPGPGMKFVEPGTVLAYPIVHPYGGYTVPCYEGYVEGGPAYDTGYYGRPVGYEHGYGAANAGYYGNNGYNNNRNINNNNNYGSDSYFSERDPSCTIM